LFACCDCTLTAIRQKEDPWNSIMSGAATGGILAARAGPRAMASAAVVGGVLLALIEGMGIMFTKMMAPPVPTAEDYAMDVTAPPTQGGLFPSLPFGGGSSAPKLPEPDLTPPPVNEPFIETDGITTFSTETTQQEPTKSSGWWPFSGK
jgi:hypothetical protein